MQFVLPHSTKLLKMADNKKKNKKENDNKNTSKKKSSSEKKEKKNDPRIRQVTGVILFCIATFLLFCFVSFFKNHFSGASQDTPNITGRIGNFLSDMFIKESFGIGSIYFIYLLVSIGVALVSKTRPNMWRIWKLAIIFLLWLPLLFATLNTENTQMLGGYVGHELYTLLKSYIGVIGVTITLVVTALIYLIAEFRINFDLIEKWNTNFTAWSERRKEKREQERLRKLEEKNNLANAVPETAEAPDRSQLEEKNNLANTSPEKNNEDDEEPIITATYEPTNETDADDLGISIIKPPYQDTEENKHDDPKDDDDLGITIITRPNANNETEKKQNETFESTAQNIELTTINISHDNDGLFDEDSTQPKETDNTLTLSPTITSHQFVDKPKTPDKTADNGVEIVINKTIEEKTVDEDNATIEHHTIDTPYDPHYELRDFIMPPLDLLNDISNNTPEINPNELENNKNRIVETLNNYGIAIDKIMATIGPTVTLYEIVPAPGVRISKIKNLEDDIALSLAALGIRIIAPIPGKGTIGIEVPNKEPQTVSMRSVLSSEKFQKTKYALPCAIGKTISNTTYVFDLAKMPHILMAGATGQGKSVGLNAIVASLLYSKHPSELKFVMVDPKKVELTLYKRIERHYLAKLPDSADAIITDTKKVVRTLNSLCVEMDARYDLLKAAECRTIIEYNEKFKSRKLLPTEGHRFLPYIVLVVDEFADLIMTAGRDVESPIARLAQLARAIGIHLIIATQRPSVNIITGSIKANFPARIAFRVISVVDSKTILDQSGANQLIGRGDMLLSTGNDLVRLQCAFIDTPEVSEITEFIGNQHGYPEAFLLPEVPEDANNSDNSCSDDSGDDLDSLFEEAARIVVQTQQGSTSMIQRKLKLGYNRAGRIIDQLEKAGIVGPFSGSKSREVKIADEFALEQILRDMGIII